MKLIETSRLLKLTLRADALVSGAVALIHTVATASLAGLTRLPEPLILGTGIFLFAYVLLLLAMSAPARLWTPLVRLVIVGNAIWAVEALTLVGGAGGVEPGGLGVAWLIIHAVTVAGFALIQFVGLRRSRPVSTPALRGAQA